MPGSRPNTPLAVLEERRPQPRRKLLRPVSILPTGGCSDDVLEAELVDLSGSGIGLRLSCPLGPGRTFSLFTIDVKHGPVSLEYRVVRCDSAGGGAFHVGAVFVRSPRATG